MLHFINTLLILHYYYHVTKILGVFSKATLVNRYLHENNEIFQKHLTGAIMFLRDPCCSFLFLEIVFWKTMVDYLI